MSAPETNSKFSPAPPEPAMWCLSWQQLNPAARFEVGSPWRSAPLPQLDFDSLSTLGRHSEVPPGSEPAVEFLPWWKLNLETAFEVGSEGQSRSPSFESTSMLGTNSRSSPATERAF
jgi:hypothetical protein